MSSISTLTPVCFSYSLAKTSCVIMPHVAGRKIPRRVIPSCARLTAGADNVEPTAAPPATRAERPTVESAPAAPACFSICRRDILALPRLCNWAPLLAWVSFIVVPALSFSFSANTVAWMRSGYRPDRLLVAGASFRLPVLGTDLNLDHVLVLLDRLDRSDDVIERNDFRDDVFRVEATALN